MDGTTMAEAGLGTPKPCEDVGRHDGYSRTRRYTGKRLLRARFSVRKRVAADHDCDEAGGLRNRSGEQGLDGTDTTIERRSMSGEWEDQYAQEQGCSAHKIELGTLNRCCWNDDSNACHWHLQRPGWSR